MDDLSLPVSPGGANRARGTLDAAFRRVGRRTEILGPYETGGYRLRLPRTREAACEAVIVNTGGGMAGGDHARFRFVTHDRAAAVVTTTAAEKIYRSDGAGTAIDVALSLGEGSTFAWLPQETILFEGADLARTLSVEMAADADLLVAETLVFGRLAMGECWRTGTLRDRWRIRRDGRLVYAEDLRLDGSREAALLDRPALGAGARAAATIAWLSPDAEAKLDAVRAALEPHAGAVSAGASAWDGRLVVRALGPSPAALREAVAAALRTLRTSPLPRLWG